VTTIVKAAPAVKMGRVVSMDRAFSQVEESKNGPKNMQNSLSPGILVSQRRNDCDCYPFSGGWDWDCLGSEKTVNFSAKNWVTIF